MDRRNNFLILVLIATVGILVAAILLGGGDPAAPVPGTSPDAGAGADQSPDARAAALGSDPRADGAAADASRRDVVTPVATDGKVALRGRLVRTDGAPAADAPLAWRAGGGFEPPFVAAADDVEGRTDAAGRFELRVAAATRGRLTLARDANLLFAGADARHVDVGAHDVDHDLGDLQVTVAGRLTGRVVDETGQPVATARVRSNRDAVPLWLPGRGQAVDADGSFELVGLEPGRHTVGAEATGFVPATRTVEIGTGEEHGAVELVLTRGASVAGTVLDDRGVPLAGAKVAAFRDREMGPSVRVQGIDTDAAVETDAAGYFVLSGIEGDRVSLRAWSEGYAPRTATDVAVGTGNVTLRLDRLGRITGVLLDTEGTPLAASRVTARVFGENAAFDFGSISPSTETDAEGRFELVGVRPGTVTLEARGASHLPVEGYTVQVVAGMTVSNVMLRAETGAVVIATVVDAAGKPVEGAQVTVTEPAGAPVVAAGPGRRVEVRATRGARGPGGFQVFDGGEPSVLREARTGADGHARIGGLPTGPVRVRASSDEHAPSRPVELAVPRRGEVEAVLTLRPAGRVRITTVSPTGEPAPEVCFVLRGPDGGDPADGVTERGTTDAQGVATVGPLPAGRYTATVQLSAPPAVLGDGMRFVVGGARGDEVADTARQVTVTAGETAEVELQQPVLTRLFGTVQDAAGPAANVEVRLGTDATPSFAPGWTAKSDASGAFEVAGLPAGSYRLEWGRAQQLVRHRDELVVPAGVPELRRDLQLSGGTVRVEVRADTGAPLAGADVSLRRAGESASGPRGVMISTAIRTDGEGGGSMQSITMGGPGTVRTGDDGVAVVEDVPPGEYVLVVQADGHADGRVEDVQVVDARPTDVGVVALQGAGAVAGAVQGFADGEDVRIAMIEVRAVGSDGEPRREMAMDGTFRVDRLTPGDWELRVERARGSGTPGPWRTVTVRAGETATLDLPLAGG